MIGAGGMTQKSKTNKSTCIWLINNKKHRSFQWHRCNVLEVDHEHFALPVAPILYVVHQKSMSLITGDQETKLFSLHLELVRWFSGVTSAKRTHFSLVLWMLRRDLLSDNHVMGRYWSFSFSLIVVRSYDLMMSYLSFQSGSILRPKDDLFKFSE